MRSKCLWLARLGPIGYFPAPGTVATICTMPLVYVLTLLAYAAVFRVFICLLAFACVHWIFEELPSSDPRELVLDEVVGCIIAFWGITLSYTSVCIGVLLFRFFDVSKWFGLHALQRFPGAWGIFLDDIGAGLYTLVILHLLGYSA